jgi:undecaprenyl-diphosphatase
MPDWLAVILLGMIEGVTEFLPISSTGHLLIVENLHWLPQQSEMFNVVIQCGAVLAVFAVLARRVQELLTSLGRRATQEYLLKLGLAFGITVVGMLAAKKLGFKLTKTIHPVAWATLIGGVAILGLERWLRGRPQSSEVAWAIAIAVGAAQIVAGVFPGTSRAGATILMALAFGLSRPAATEFSFLLGIPTLLAAGAKEAYDALKLPGPEATNWGLVALGTVVSGVTAFLVVKWLLRFVQSHTFVGFGWYRIVLGVGLLLLTLR